MPPNTQSAAQIVTKRKVSLPIQLAAVFVALPTALGIFAVGSRLLSGFELVTALVTALMAVVLIAAFALFSLKRWALYTVTAAEIISVSVSAYTGNLGWGDAVGVAAIIVLWVYYRDFI